jgi:hypothetical protein
VVSDYKVDTIIIQEALMTIFIINGDTDERLKTINASGADEASEQGTKWAGLFDEFLPLPGTNFYWSANPELAGPEFDPFPETLAEVARLEARIAELEVGS